MFFKKKKPPQEYLMILAKENLTAEQAGYSDMEVPVPSEVFEGKSFNTRIIRFVICPCGCDDQAELVPAKYVNDFGSTEIARR